MELAEYVVLSLDPDRTRSSVEGCGGEVIEELPNGIMLVRAPRECRIEAELIDENVEFRIQAVPFVPQAVRSVVTTARCSAAIGAPAVWSRYRGRVGVAVIDSGIEEVEGLKGKVVKRVEVVESEGMNPHGTLVAQMLAGSEVVIGALSFAGVAPGARLYSYRVVDAEGRASYFNVIKALSMAIDEPEVKVINISLGSPRPCCGSTFDYLAAQAASVGKVVVVSAGNFGPRPWSVACPGGLRPVISVGCVCLAIDHDRAAWFSARGPGCGTCIKPDAVAYGGCGDLTGARQPIEVVAFPMDGKVVCARGTSFSAPMVSGLAAILYEAGLKNAFQLQEVLRLSCKDLGPPGKDNTYGWGLINAPKAVEVLGAAPPTTIRREAIDYTKRLLLLVGGLALAYTLVRW